MLESDIDRIVLKCPILVQSPRHLQAEILRRVWRGAGWPEAGMDQRRWRRLAAQASGPPMRVSLVGGIEVITDPLFVVLRRVGPAPAPGPLPGSAMPLELPGEIEITWGGGRVVATLDPGAPRNETIDLDALIPPLCVRGPVAGDRFEPLGMDGRSTPLNDFFRGRGVWRDRRGDVPLVCDERGIIWVVGHRIAHRVRQTSATSRTLGLRFDAFPNSCD